MKRLTITFVFIVAVASLVALTSAGAQRPEERTITLIARDVSFHIVDNPPRQGRKAPPLAGDAAVFQQHLFTRANRRAGTFGAQCVATSGGARGRFLCTGVYALAGGTLMVQALVLSEENVETAIVGGTGAYAGARGHVTSRPTRDGHIDTLHLLR